MIELFRCDGCQRGLPLAAFQKGRGSIDYVRCLWHCCECGERVPAGGLHVRWMLRRDFPEVLAIEAASFGAPWSEADFVRCLRQTNVIGLVAERDGHVVGFMIYELCGGYFDLLNLAVSPRRCGVGKTLVNWLWGKLFRTRRRSIRTMVRETNLDAQLFFRAQGFVAEAVRRDAYEDCAEDAIVMRCWQPLDDRLPPQHPAEEGASHGH